MEVLVSFAILATVTTTMLHVVSSSGEAAIKGDEIYAASEIAKSKMDLVGLLIPLTLGRQDGDAGRGFIWVATIEPYGKTERQAKRRQDWRLYQVKISVHKKSAASTPLAELTSLRLGPGNE